MSSCCAVESHANAQPPKTGWRSRLFAWFNKPGDGAMQQMRAIKSRLFAQMPLNAHVLDVGIGSGPNLQYYILRVRPLALNG
jgi:hypothetical protein